MSDQFGPSDPPVRKGRRDPRLADELARAEGVVERRPEMDMVPLGDDHLLDVPGQEAEDGVWLIDGDIIACKVTREASDEYGRTWAAYGVQTRVLEDEEEADAFLRVKEQVVARTSQILAESQEQFQLLAEEQEEERAHRPIRPQRRG